VIRYISRYNEDGKKVKSKGAFVWVVEARKTADGSWIFKEFEPKFTGEEPSPYAYVGNEYSYRPMIYDPQIQSTVCNFRFYFFFFFGLDEIFLITIMIL